jgi:hypothetical protein
MNAIQFWTLAFLITLSAISASDLTQQISPRQPDTAKIFLSQVSVDLQPNNMVNSDSLTDDEFNPEEVLTDVAIRRNRHRIFGTIVGCGILSCGVCMFTTLTLLIIIISYLT